MDYRGFAFLFIISLFAQNVAMANCDVFVEKQRMLPVVHEHARFIDWTNSVDSSAFRGTVFRVSLEKGRAVAKSSKGQITITLFSDLLDFVKRLDVDIGAALDAIQLSAMRRLRFVEVNPLMHFRKRKTDAINILFDSPALYFDVTADRHRLQLQRIPVGTNKEIYMMRFSSIVDGHEAEVLTRYWNVKLFLHHKVDSNPIGEPLM